MKKYLAISVLTMLQQLLCAQTYDYKGYTYDLPKNENDSTITFYPIAPARLAMAEPERDGVVKCAVPSHPDKSVLIYLDSWGVKQTASSQVEVEDTLKNAQLVADKRAYIELRLKAIELVRAEVAAIKAQEGNKLTDKKQIDLYLEVLQNYAAEITSSGQSGSWTLAKTMQGAYQQSRLEQGKVKVGKQFMAAAPVYEAELAEEEAMLRKVLNISDREEFLRTKITRDDLIGRRSVLLIKKLTEGTPEYDAIKAKYSDVIYNYDELAARYEARSGHLQKKRITISFKNPILSDTAVTVHNPNFRGIGYAEWEWLQSLNDYAQNAGLEHVVTSFPVEADYYRSDKYPDYEFYKSDWQRGRNGWYAITKGGDLVGVQHKGYERDSVVKAAMIYDFEHNAYDIQSESADVQKWARYLLNKRGNSQLDAIDSQSFGIWLSAALLLDEEKKARTLYARRRISQAEYNRRIASLKAKAQSLRKAANAVAAKMPSAESRNRAERYVEQLERDAKDRYDHMNAERLNGTQMLLVTRDGAAKALLTYYIDSDNTLNWSYDVIEKQ